MFVILSKLNYYGTDFQLVLSSTVNSKYKNTSFIGRQYEIRTFGLVHHFGILPCFFHVSILSVWVIVCNLINTSLFHLRYFLSIKYYEQEEGVKSPC